MITRPVTIGRLQTFLLLVAGATALGAGAGLGIRHAQKTGATAMSIVGLTVLVLGGVLLVRGLTRVWRSLPRWYRLLTVPLRVALILPASSVGLAVAYTQVPPTELGTGSPADHGLAFTDLTLTTDDGTRLSAWLVPPRNGAVVVLLHGAGSTRTSVLPQAAVLGRNGFGVLMLDARGHGSSGGRGMDLGWFGDDDIAAAVDYVNEVLDVPSSRTGLVGLSMGAEEAIGAAPSTHVAAVVAEGATARTAEDKDQWLPGGMSGTTQRALDRVTYTLTDLLTPADVPLSLHRAVTDAADTEFLLITAGREPDESRAAEVLRRAGPTRVSVWSVPQSSHTGGLRTDPAEWERRVVGFLERRLT